MKTQSIIAAIAALFPSALAAPAPASTPASGSSPPTTPSPVTFLLKASSDNSAINGLEVHASNQYFYLNVPTSSYCKTTCPNSMFTIFSTVGDGNLELSIGDSRGREKVYGIYGPSGKGRLAFNYPASSASPYAKFTKFELVNGDLKFAGGDFLACPNPDGFANAYSVYTGDGGMAGQPGCSSFSAQYALIAGPAVWNYN